MDFHMELDTRGAARGRNNADYKVVVYHDPWFGGDRPAVERVFCGDRSTILGPAPERLFGARGEALAWAQQDQLVGMHDMLHRPGVSTCML